MPSSFGLCHSFVIRHSSFVILIMPTDSPIIEVNNLVRRFGDRAVLDDISFNVHRGETLVIMGGSGCGKSTLLRHMIGSMKPTSGSVKLFGKEITAMKEREVEHVRLRFGMLFQSGALLASLTVGDNIALPLWQHTDKSGDEVEEIVKQKLQMVGLTGFEDLKPEEIRNSPNPEVQQFIHGQPDGPIPLNVSQEEHKDHQHVRPRPFLGARFRFHHKHP